MEANEQAQANHYEEISIPLSIISDLKGRTLPTPERLGLVMMSRMSRGMWRIRLLVIKARRRCRLV